MLIDHLGVLVIREAFPYIRVFVNNQTYDGCFKCLVATITKPAS